MKLFREAIIIFGIYLIGEVISRTFKLPVPGNILGMIILLVLLCTKVVKVKQVETVSNFLLDHLAFFFVPASVGLMSSASIIKDSWIRLLIVCIATTIIIIGTTGLIVQFISRRSQKGGKEIGNTEK